MNFQQIDVLTPLLWHRYSSGIALRILPEIQVLLLEDAIGCGIGLIIQIHDWRFTLNLLSHRTLFAKIVSVDPFGTLCSLFFGIQLGHQFLNLVDHLLLFLDILFGV